MSPLVQILENQILILEVLRREIPHLRGINQNMVNAIEKSKAIIKDSGVKSRPI
jgi:hypothetical protein